MIRYLLTVTLLAGLSGPALAESCPVPQGWAKPARHVAARTPNLRFALKPNSSAQLQLHPEPGVAVPLKKERAKQPREFAGLAALEVLKAGKLEVALSGRAYVDLVRDGRALESTAHGHKNCTGVAKTVAFDVKPGRYLVQIADAKLRTIKVGFRTP
jgi:hypothetical protein